MVLFIFALFTGILLLWQGAEFLIRGATEIARNLDVTPFVIGITIVAPIVLFILAFDAFLSRIDGAILIAGAFVFFMRFL